MSTDPLSTGHGDMVILHVVAPGKVGGLERVVQSLAAGHRAAGHRAVVSVILESSDAASTHPLLQSLRDRAVEVIPLAVGTRAYMTERAAIADLCRRLQPTVVHTHGYRPDVVDAGVARRLGIPTVTTVHGFTGGDWKNRLYERLQRRAFRRFDAVVAVSQPLGAALQRCGVPRDSLHVIQNAWDGAVTFLDRTAARQALGVPEGSPPRIGWAGRMSVEKGPDVVLDALALLGDDSVALSMVGDGAGRGRLRARAASLGVAGRVTWHGIVPQAARLFPAFDVFVLSSRTEGTPMVLFEAMAAGVPVVATAVGGVPAVLSPEEAVLVPPGNPRALADAVTRVLRDPAERRRRVVAARQRLEREFAARPWLERYETLYQSVQR